MVCAKSLEVLRTRGVRVRNCEGGGEEHLVPDSCLDSGCLLKERGAPSRQPPADLGDDMALLFSMLWPSDAQRSLSLLSGAPGALGEVWLVSCGPPALDKSAWSSSSSVIASGNTRVALGGGGIAGWDGGG